MVGLMLASITGDSHIYINIIRALCVSHCRNSQRQLPIEETDESGNAEDDSGNDESFYEYQYVIPMDKYET